VKKIPVATVLLEPWTSGYVVQCVNHLSPSNPSSFKFHSDLKLGMKPVPVQAYKCVSVHITVRMRVKQGGVKLLGCCLVTKPWPPVHVTRFKTCWHQIPRMLPYRS